MNPEERYSVILEIQKELNLELQTLFDESKDKGREYLSTVLLKRIPTMVSELENKGHKFGRCEYSGDINYEDSEQWYSSGSTMGSGIVLHFHGFSVQASWVD